MRNSERNTCKPSAQAADAGTLAFWVSIGAALLALFTFLAA